ncbi:hypothetical protein FOA43_002949 [Brettanomyces nanus]|uniref:Uncharacterized protein n=1 Tax=Eeniella nana TaxID=13502 RepID=A0A875S6G9_EENNA|nr:uncharacterized protein FOA43_002949 [Brettanomyces nanus]QPG75592.1 hypothetical protein FOA43_002949 [Brettanomyces nanus]
MLRNVPKATSFAHSSKMTFQSCLTANNVFKRPSSLHVAENARGMYSGSRARSFHMSQRNNSNNSGSGVNQVFAKIPEIKEYTQNVSNKRQLPYYKQLMAFDDCLTHNSSFDISTGRIIGSSKQFWDSVKRIMPLYEELMSTGEMTERRMDEMVSLLRNGLRVHRWELTKLNKNVDKDLNTPLQQLHELLKKSLLKVSSDIVSADSSVRISARGLTNLFKAFKDMGLADEAAQVWNRGKNNEKLYELFTAESVLGSVFSLFVDNNDFDFDEIWAIYSRIKASKPSYEKIHGELQIAMVRACLLKGHTEEALKIFTEVTSNVLQEFNEKNMDPPSRLRSYMTTAHMSFIGYCQDFETSNVFFKGALKGDLPYLTPLQMNFVKRFMHNTWNNTRNFDHVTDIWLSTWKYYESHHRSNSSISSSLNDTFLDIFFTRYPNFDVESSRALKKVLADYSEIRQMDEPFFNCLLTKSMAWKNTNFFKSIMRAAEMYHFPKTNVFYRCSLKASGAVDLPSDQIFNVFYKLLDSNVEMGSRQITNADWFALRDATVRSHHINAEKIDLYFKLWKLSSLFFVSLQNLKLYVGLDMKLNRAYGRVFREIEYVDASDIHLPQLRFFSRNRAIGNYYMSQNINL